MQCFAMQAGRASWGAARTRPGVSNFIVCRSTCPVVGPFHHVLDLFDVLIPGEGVSGNHVDLLNLGMHQAA